MSISRATQLIAEYTAEQLAGFVHKNTQALAEQDMFLTPALYAHVTMLAGGLEKALSRIADLEEKLARGA